MIVIISIIGSFASIISLILFIIDKYKKKKQPQTRNSGCFSKNSTK